MSEPDLMTPRSGRVKAARKLGRRADRAAHRLFLVEGEKTLREALDLDGCVVEVFATPPACERYADLRDRVTGLGRPWQPCTEEAIASLAGTVTPQGLVAVCRFVDVPLDRVLAARTLAICADVRDPGNAGTIIRTADASGADAVVLAGHSVDPYNDKTARATVGSLFHVPVVVAPDVAATISAVQGAGLTVLAADGAGEQGLFEAARDGLLDGRVAWLFGNEARGLPDSLAALADHRVAIPILGRAESLNLAIAAAVCLYASAQRRGVAG